MQVTLDIPTLAHVQANTTTTATLSDSAVPEVQYLTLDGVKVKLTLNRNRDRHMVYSVRTQKYIASSPNSAENAVKAARAEIYKARKAAREAKKAAA